MSQANQMPSRRSYWVDAGRFLAGALPITPDPLESAVRLKPFLEVGISCFINLMEPTERDHDGRLFLPYEPILVELAVRHKLAVPRCLRFPIPDLGVPSRGQMTEILDTIDRLRAEKRAVFLHCWGGKGRTGTVVGCWLLRHQLAKPDTVIARIQQLRATDANVSQPSPETRQQIAFVQSWKEAASA